MILFCELSSLYRSINSIEQEIQQKHGLVLNEAMILCLLRNGMLSSKMINKEIGLTATHSSKLIKSLESKNLISRTLGVEDKRKMYFELSNLGVDKIHEIAYLSEKLYKKIKNEIKNLDQ